jgi:hypothetical protein
MSKRNKREWGLFINPKTGRKNYNVLCRKCKRRCKQSYRAIVISCRKFTPNWGRKSAPDSPRNEGSEEPMQQHQPIFKRRLGRKKRGKIAPNMPLLDMGRTMQRIENKTRKRIDLCPIHPFGCILTPKYTRLGDAARLEIR